MKLVWLELSHLCGATNTKSCFAAGGRQLAPHHPYTPWGLGGGGHFGWKIQGPYKKKLALRTEQNRGKPILTPVLRR